MKKGHRLNGDPKRHQEKTDKQRGERESKVQRGKIERHESGEGSLNCKEP